MAREADGKVSVLVDLRERSTSVGGVTNSTADVLQFASSSGTATGKVILFGRSA